MRTDQERLNAAGQYGEDSNRCLQLYRRALKIGFHGVTELDRSQALSNLRQSQAQMTQLRIDIRTSENRLCTLLGIPTSIWSRCWNAPQKTIPTVPDSVVVGIPADLLRRRPDVRRAERQAAAQAEQIGIAETDLYPAFSINGTLGWQASTFSELFRSQALNASVGPSFHWNLLNYGRIVNNIRFQDATFRELVATYQQTVLNADEEVEDGIVTFLQSQEQARLLRESVDAAYRALMVIIAQYENPVQAQNIDFNRYAVILQNLIQQQDQWAQSRGQVDLGLIEVYRGLGGGWQLRLQPGCARNGWRGAGATGGSQSASCSAARAGSDSSAAGRSTAGSAARRRPSSGAAANTGADSTCCRTASRHDESASAGAGRGTNSPAGERTGG